MKNEKLLVKQLYAYTNMGDIIVKTDTGITGRWVSQWEKGVFIQEKDKEGITPVLLDSIDQTLEWEVIEDLTNKK